MSAQVIPIGARAASAASGTPRTTPATATPHSGAYRIRPARSDDREPLVAMLLSCSRETLHARFLTYAPAAASSYVESLFADPACYCAVVERPRSGAAPEIVAEGSLFFDGGRAAEVALVVRDDCQGRGVGAALAQHLCDQAARRGVDRLEFTALTRNTRIVRVFRRAVSDTEFGPPEAGVITSTLRLRAGRPGPVRLAA
jgi:GNAT superfamily N-acetyltransferase